MDQETLLLKIYEASRESSEQLAALDAKLDAYDIPKLRSDVADNKAKVQELNTKIHTWAGIAGALGTVLGALGFKGMEHWLNSL
jgi:hypothetical protein